MICIEPTEPPNYTRQKVCNDCKHFCYYKPVDAYACMKYPPVIKLEGLSTMFKVYKLPNFAASHTCDEWKPK